MSDFMENVYGPLAKDYCLYFYMLSIFGFILTIFTLIVGFYIGLSKRKDFTFYVQVVLGSLAYGLFYFQNRLLHSMCVNSLN